MSGLVGEEAAIQVLKAGASDFITKPLKLDHVVLVVQRVLETVALRRLAGEREYYKELSISDGLTHVANYRHFNHVLQQEVERQRRFQRPLTLLLIAVLTGLSLWWSQPADRGTPHVDVDVDVDKDTTPLVHLRILGSGTKETP